MSDEHPSFGLVQISRVTGKRPFFGASAVTTPEYFAIRIRYARRDLQDGVEWFFPARGERDIVEVALTPAQFVELVTSMNMGAGVPCTIDYLDGKRVSFPPRLKSVETHIRERFDAKIAASVRKAKEGRALIEGVLARVKMSKKAAEEIVSVYDAAVQFLESDASYVVQTFQEAAVDTLMKAKADADAWLVGAIHRAGLDVAKTHGLQKYLQPGDKLDEE